MMDITSCLARSLGEVLFNRYRDFSPSTLSKNSGNISTSLIYKDTKFFFFLAFCLVGSDNVDSRNLDVSHRQRRKTYRTCCEPYN